MKRPQRVCGICLVHTPRSEFPSSEPRQRTSTRGLDPLDLQLSSLLHESPSSGFPFAACIKGFTKVGRGSVVLPVGRRTATLLTTLGTLQEMATPYWWIISTGATHGIGEARKSSWSATLCRAPRKSVHVALRVGWYVWKTVHPCRVESFRKAVSTVKDDLVTDPEIIDNMNGMLKLVDNV